MIKDCKTIAEYAIKKWMEDNGFVMAEFSVEMDGNTGIITDKTGARMPVKYDQAAKKVEVEE